MALIRAASSDLLLSLSNELAQYGPLETSTSNEELIQAIPECAFSKAIYYVEPRQNLFVRGV